MRGEGGGLLPAGAALALAKGMTSIKLTNRAEIDAGIYYLKAKVYLSACIRCRGVSLTEVLICTLICSPT
jgi:hypothetical protein